MTGIKALHAVAICLAVAVVASGCIWTHEQMYGYRSAVEEGLTESGREELPMETIQFPVVAGRDIDGNDFVVPTDFAGELNLVLMRSRGNTSTMSIRGCRTSANLNPRGRDSACTRCQPCGSMCLAQHIDTERYDVV